MEDFSTGNFNYFEALKASLEEALAYERGDHSRCRVSVVEIPDSDIKPTVQEIKDTEKAGRNEK